MPQRIRNAVAAIRAARQFQNRDDGIIYRIADEDIDPAYQGGLPDPANSTWSNQAPDPGNPSTTSRPAPTGHQTAPPSVPFNTSGHHSREPYGYNSNPQPPVSTHYQAPYSTHGPYYAHGTQTGYMQSSPQTFAQSYQQPLQPLTNSIQASAHNFPYTQHAQGSPPDAVFNGGYSQNIPHTTTTNNSYDQQYIQPPHLERAHTAPIPLQYIPSPVSQRTWTMPVQEPCWTCPTHPSHMINDANPCPACQMIYSQR